jgi:hypothetical protein
LIAGKNHPQGVGAFRRSNFGIKNRALPIDIYDHSIRKSLDYSQRSQQRGELSDQGPLPALTLGCNFRRRKADPPFFEHLL